MRSRSIIGVPLCGLIGLAVLAAVPAAQAQPLGIAHGAGAKESIITATGTARVERTPDFVDVSVGVIAEEATAAETQASASHTMEKAIEAINALKLAGLEPKTGAVVLAARYQQRQRGGEDAPKIIGYSGTIMLRVRTTDTQSVAKIIDAALGAGCNRVESVEFGIKEALEAREEAIRLAMQAAKRKAQVMAESLDLHLARVVEASTSSHQSGWVRSYANSAQIAGGSEDARAGEEQSPIVPGKVEIWVDATITYTAALESEK